MTHPKLTYVAQVVAALLLAFVSVMKLRGDPGSIAIFTSLDMEPTGRYIIGVVELAAALLLLSPFAASGSVLALGVIGGAVLAHVTQLGLVVNGDGGRLVGMLLVVLLCSGYVLVTRRKELPIVGGTL